MAFQTAKPTGPRRSEGPLIGTHRVIPAPPPPPVFRPPAAKVNGKTNGDLLRAVSSLSADIDQMVRELDNYSARCTDYFLDALGILIDLQQQREAGRYRQGKHGAPDANGARIGVWANALKVKSEAEKAAFRKRVSQENQLTYYRQYFTGFYGKPQSVEDAIARIAEVRVSLPQIFSKLALARARHLDRLLRALEIIA